MGGTIASDFHLFDLRSAGVINYKQFTSDRVERGQHVSNFCEELLKCTVDGFSREGPVVKFSLGSEHATQVLSIDANNDFTPVEFTIRARHDPSLTSSKVVWKSQSGVFVPTAFSMELHAPQLYENIRYDYQFVWSNVNEQVPADLFDFRTFSDVWDEVPAVDKRQPNNPTIGKWSNGRFTKVTAAGGVNLYSPTSGPILRWLLIGNGVVIGGFAILWFAHYRKGRQ
jgi:hypothetical protein